MKQSEDINMPRQFQPGNTPEEEYPTLSEHQTTGGTLSDIANQTIGISPEEARQEGAVNAAVAAKARNEIRTFHGLNNPVLRDNIKKGMFPKQEVLPPAEELSDAQRMATGITGDTETDIHNALKEGLGY